MRQLFVRTSLKEKNAVDNRSVYHDVQKVAFFGYCDWTVEDLANTALRYREKPESSWILACHILYPRFCAIQVKNMNTNEERNKHRLRDSSPKISHYLSTPIALVSGSSPTSTYPNYTRIPHANRSQFIARLAAPIELTN